MWHEVPRALAAEMSGIEDHYCEKRGEVNTMDARLAPDLIERFKEADQAERVELVGRLVGHSMLVESLASAVAQAMKEANFAQVLSKRGSSGSCPDDVIRSAVPRWKTLFSADATTKFRWIFEILMDHEWDAAVGREEEHVQAERALLLNWLKKENSGSVA